MSEVDLVEVQLENAVLRIAPLELHRKNRFLELPLEVLVRREKEHLGELLRYRAAALDDSTASEVLVDGPSDARGVDAVV